MVGHGHRNKPRVYELAKKRKLQRSVWGGEGRGGRGGERREREGLSQHRRRHRVVSVAKSGQLFRATRKYFAKLPGQCRRPPLTTPLCPSVLSIVALCPQHESNPITHSHTHIHARVCVCLLRIQLLQIVSISHVY